MKIRRFLCFLVIFAAIFAACSSTDSSREDTQTIVPDDSPRRTVTVNWPDGSALRGYGLEGITQPPGTTVSAAVMHMGFYVIGLEGGGKPAFDNIIGQIAEIPGSTIITNAQDSGAILIGFMMSEGNIVNILLELENGDISIQAYPLD